LISIRAGIKLLSLTISVEHKAAKFPLTDMTGNLAVRREQHAASIALKENLLVCSPIK
jgi:hypothetical protein